MSYNPELGDGKAKASFHKNVPSTILHVLHNVIHVINAPIWTSYPGFEGFVSNNLSYLYIMQLWSLLGHCQIYGWLDSGIFRIVMIYVMFIIKDWYWDSSTHRSGNKCNGPIGCLDGVIVCVNNSLINHLAYPNIYATLHTWTTFANCSAKVFGNWGYSPYFDSVWFNGVRLMEQFASRFSHLL